MMKEGIGIQFILNDNEDGWYYYQVSGIMILQMEWEDR